MDDALISGLDELAASLLAATHDDLSLQDKVAVSRGWRLGRNQASHCPRRTKERRAETRRQEARLRGRQPRATKEAGFQAMEPTWKPDDADGSGLPALRAMVSGNCGTNSD